MPAHTAKTLRQPFSMDIAMEADAQADHALREPGEPSLDRFAAELSAMINVAAATAESLNRRLHEAGEGESRAAATSDQLQEQLRLGARMLKAFQTQIARVETTLHSQKAYEQQVNDTQAKIEQCFAGIEACVDKTVESVAVRLAEQARTAMAKFDAGVAARQQRLGEIDARIAHCAEGIDGICEMIESVQASAQSAAASNQHTLERLHTAASEARQMLVQQDQARKSLASDLCAVREELTNIDQRGEAAHNAAREALTLSTRADALLRDRLGEVDQAQHAAEHVANTVVSLNELLVRLQPWEKLLLGGTISADGLPEPLAKVAGEVRKQISQDMNWLSLTMRDVAERVSHLASVAPDEAAGTRSVAAEEPVERSPERQVPELHVHVKKPLRLRTFNAGA